MKSDYLYSKSENSSTGVNVFNYYVFEYDEDKRFGGYYRPDVENVIVIKCKTIAGVANANFVTYRASSNDGYVSEPMNKVSNPSQLYGYPLSLGYGSVIDTIEDMSFPIFLNEDDFNHYVETGDDSRAVNFNDIHSTKADFYLTNNGDTISVRHQWQDPTQQGTKITLVEYNFKESILDTQKTFSAVGDNIDFNKSWNDVVGNPLVVTLDVTITAYGGNVELCTLKATIKRKRLLLGEVSAVVTVGEDNGYHLFATTDNSFDDIGDNADEESDAADNDGDGSNFGGFSNLCSTYKVSKNALNDLGQFIWNNSIFDNIKNMNNSPLENIISCHYMPYSFDSAIQNNIIIGNVDTSVSGVKLSQNMVKKNYATFQIPKANSGFLGYEPYTSVSLYLPLVGMIDLIPNDVCGYTVTVDYVFDFVVGSFGVLVYTSKGGGKTLIYSTQGTCAVDIPLTSSNKAQVQAAILQSGVSLVGDIGTKNVGGAINDLMSIATTQNHSKTFGSPSSMVGALSPQYCYYVLRTPILKLPQTFAHTKGYICMETYKLSDLKGFTKLTNDVDLSGFDCTSNELQRLRDILTSGFYL